jgi:hypothetical protein
MKVKWACTYRCVASKGILETGVYTLIEKPDEKRAEEQVRK